MSADAKGAYAASTPRPMRPRGSVTPEQKKENRARIAQARTAAVRRLIETHPEDWNLIYDEENRARGVTSTPAGRVIGRVDRRRQEDEEASENEDFPEGWEAAGWAALAEHDATAASTDSDAS